MRELSLIKAILLSYEIQNGDSGFVSAEIESRLNTINQI